MNEMVKSELESRVLAGFERMRKVYDELELRLNELQRAREAKSALPNIGQYLSQSQEQLNQIEMEIAPSRTQLEQGKQPPSSKYASAKAEVADRLSSVLARVDAVRDEVSAEYQKLVPEVDESVRGNMMRNAYGKYGR